MTDATAGRTRKAPAPTTPKRRRRRHRAASILVHPSVGNNTHGVLPVVLIIAAVQLFLPDSVSLGPPWLIPAVEMIGAPAGFLIKRQGAVTPRTMVIGATFYLTFLVFASVSNAILLLQTLLDEPNTDRNGEMLLYAGFGVLVINTLSFALIYWWIDGGGPRARELGEVKYPDFLFPQQSMGMDWTPHLEDYVFTAWTNLIAFSPTDTMPLTRRVKGLFVLQSAVSLVTVVVTVSRAINLLN